MENLSTIYAILGRSDEALEIVEDLLDREYSGALTIHGLMLDVIWDPIRDDPRFQALIEKHS